MGIKEFAHGILQNLSSLMGQNTLQNGGFKFFLIHLEKKYMDFQPTTKIKWRNDKNHHQNVPKIGLKT